MRARRGALAPRAPRGRPPPPRRAPRYRALALAAALFGLACAAATAFATAPRAPRSTLAAAAAAAAAEDASEEEFISVYIDGRDLLERAAVRDALARHGIDADAPHDQLMK